MSKLRKAMRCWWTFLMAGSLVELPYNVATPLFKRSSKTAADHRPTVMIQKK